MKERKYPEYLEEIFGPNLDSIFGTEEELLKETNLKIIQLETETQLWKEK